VVQCDATHLNIAAVSILAKTRRDAHVEASCAEDPSLDERYDFLANKAYGTPRHLSGLRQFGPTPSTHVFCPGGGGGGCGSSSRSERCKES